MKWKGVALIAMLFLSMFSGVVKGTTASSGASSNDLNENITAFSIFWETLGQEAQLVAIVNSTGNNVTDLIQNSILGEENAANISALIWEAYTELRRSGVKMDYSEDELKDMAREIAQNGLPDEVVDELRSSGWNDEEIKALEEYIKENTDSITGSFSMSAFLQALSDSFIFTGWKYAKYETWAVEKEFWPASPSQAPSGTLTSNPLVSTSSILSAIINQNPNSLVYAVRSTKSDVMDTIYSASTYYSNGGIGFSTVTIDSRGKTVRRYSWENALKAYRTLGELYTIAVAIEKGNSNPELWGLARQKYDELEEYMKVRLVSTSFTPNPSPPRPRPMPTPLDLSTPEPLTSTSSQEPVFRINAVRVVRASHDTNPIKYHVAIDYTVSGGQVVVYNVTFNTGSEEQAVTPGILDPGSGTIESGNFTTPVGVLDGSLKVKVSGIVTITYRPVTGPGGENIVIKSTSSVESVSEPATLDYGDETTSIRVIKLEYTGTFDLISQLDPEKVKVKVMPSKDVAEVGDSITFRLRIENGNTLPVRGYYTLYAQVPDGSGKRTVRLGGGKLTLGANKETEVTVSTVPYPEPGRYEYFAVFSYAGFQAEDRGSVLVQREDDPGKVYIEGVEVDPDLPKEYETVNFTVTLGNTYPTAEDLKIALYIDGRVVDEKNVEILANSENKVVLRWSSAEKGDHHYRIEVNRTLGKVNLGMVDTYSGNITAFDGDFGVSFTAWPRTLDGGGRVWFTLKLRVYHSKYDFKDNSNDPLPDILMSTSPTVTYHIKIVDQNGIVIKNFNYDMPDKAGVYTLWISGPILYRTGNYTFKLVVDDFIYNEEGKPLGLGTEEQREAKVEVTPPTTKKAFMGCDNMKLSAEKGNLVLDMKCEVYFTNPTDVEWNITRIDIDPSRILATERTKDVTIGIPAETIITRKVAPGGVGEFKLDYHGVLSESNLLQTAFDLKDLAGFKVPVQVNFTVYANGHPYVVTSNGTILDLGYTVTQYVTITINHDRVIEHIAIPVTIGITTTIAATYILESTEAGAALGSVVPGAGTLVGAALGFIAGVIAYEYLDAP